MNIRQTDIQKPDGGANHQRPCEFLFHHDLLCAAAVRRVGAIFILFGARSIADAAGAAMRRMA
jgi:hypothetical protein